MAYTTNYLQEVTAMQSHVAMTISACFAVLWQLHSIRQSVPRPILQSLVASPVLSWPDYGNATLTSIPSHHQAASVGNECGCPVGVQFIEV